MDHKPFKRFIHISESLSTHSTFFCYLHSDELSMIPSCNRMINWVRVCNDWIGKDELVHFDIIGENIDREVQTLHNSYEFILRVVSSLESRNYLEFLGKSHFLEEVRYLQAKSLSIEKFTFQHLFPVFLSLPFQNVGFFGQFNLSQSDI